VKHSPLAFLSDYPAIQASASLTLHREGLKPNGLSMLFEIMSVTKKPDLTDPVLTAKLGKGMGHNYYGEPAWPNDFLYIFPVVILGTFGMCNWFICSGTFCYW